MLSEKEGIAMCVVQNFTQLEEAMREKAREVLIMGQLADQIKQAVKEPDDHFWNDGCIQSFLQHIQCDYTIDFRKNFQSVPIILHHIERTRYDSGDDANGEW